MSASNETSFETLKGRRCVVTGANGFVGSHLTRRLVEMGADARALVRETSDVSLLDDVDAERVLGDVTDRDSLEAAFAGADVVFHVAGIVKAFDDAAYDRVNIDGTENVCAAVEAVAPDLSRLVCVSSMAASGPSKNGEARSESDPEEPVSIYGRSKLAAEERVRARGDSLPWTIVRPPMIYGPGDSALLDLFAALKRHLKGVITGGPRIYSNIYVGDLVEGLLVTAVHPKAVGETFFVASDEVLSYKAFQEVIIEALDTWAMRIPVPQFLMPMVGRIADRRARRTGKLSVLSSQKVAEALAKAWHVSPDKARERLGFEAKTPVREGIRMQAEWYREHGWL